MKLELWDFDEMGPLDHCLTCFRAEREDDEYAFCERCGEESGPFNEVFREPKESKCHYCHRSPVISYCGWCAKPICSHCNDEGHGGMLLLYGGKHWNCCKRCVQKQEATRTRFLIKVHSSGKCAKHPNQVSQFKCINCEIPLCEFCAYFFKQIRWFKVRNVVGPLCLICSRHSSWEDKDKPTSWEEVQANQWKRDNSEYLSRSNLYRGSCKSPT